MNLFEGVAAHAAPMYHFMFKSLPDEKEAIVGAVNVVKFRFDDEGAVADVDFGGEVDVTTLPVNEDSFEQRLDNIAKVMVVSGMGTEAIGHFVATVMYDEGKELVEDDWRSHCETVMDLIKGYDVKHKWAMNQLMRMARANG